jgi:TRAP-type C4-dicarboxylate transport system permease large subunit
MMRNGKAANLNIRRAAFNAQLAGRAIGAVAAIGAVGEKIMSKRKNRV